MSGNDTQLGLEAQQNSPIETKGVDNFVAESDFGVPFPNFDIIPPEFLDSDGVSTLCWAGSPLFPWVNGTPSGFVGGVGNPLVIVQSRKRASFF